MKLYLGEAFGLLFKTMPFIVIRLGTYALLGLALAVYLAIAYGVAWLLGQLLSWLGIIVFIAAVGGAWAIVQWITRYFFYLLKAAHTAVLTEIITTGKAPSGSQVEYGKTQVMDRFRDTSIMFAVDQIVDGVVRGFNRQFARIADILPIPGLESLVGLFEQVVKFATTFVDEAILSRAYQQREKNVWAVAEDGLILYAQSWKPVLTNAAALALLSYVETAIALVVLAIPAVLIGALIDWEWLRTTLGILVILGAWMFKLAFADAHALAATLLAYHRSIEGMEPNPEWKARLEQASDRFRELQQKAREAASQAMAKLPQFNGDGNDNDDWPSDGGEDGSGDRPQPI